jgi:hypothetical protein
MNSKTFPPATQATRPLLAFSLLAFSLLMLTQHASGMSVRVFNLDRGTYSAGEIILADFWLQQELDFPFTDLRVTLELTRISPTTYTPITRTSVENLDFAPMEVKSLSQKLNVPANAIPGAYLVALSVRDPSDTEVGSAQKIIIVQNPSPSYYGVQLGIPVVNSSLNIGSGIEGVHVPQNEYFYLSIEAKNVGTVALKDAPWRVVGGPTYQSNEKFTLCNGSISLEVNESKKITCKTKLEKPKTYTFNMEVLKGEEVLGSATVRVVVRGVSGSIVLVRNAKDVYSKGENVSVQVRLIGPADAINSVDGAELTLYVKKGGKEGTTLAQQAKSVDGLSTAFQEHAFSLAAPEDLDRYTLYITLAKDNVILDEFTADYEKLTPKMLLLPDGRVRDTTVGGCFDDGACEEQEKALGNCFDCRFLAETPTPKPTAKPTTTPTPTATPAAKAAAFESWFLIAGIAAIAAVAVVAFILLRKKREGKGAGGRAFGLGASLVLFAASMAFAPGIVPSVQAYSTSPGNYGYEFAYDSTMDKEYDFGNSASEPVDDLTRAGNNQAMCALKSTSPLSYWFNRSRYICTADTSGGYDCCNGDIAAARTVDMSLSFNALGSAATLFTNDSIEVSGSAIVAVCQNGYSMTMLEARLYNSSVQILNKTGYYASRGYADDNRRAVVSNIRFPADQQFFMHTYYVNSTMKAAGTHHSVFIGWTGPSSDATCGYPGCFSGNGLASLESCVLKKIAGGGLKPLPDFVTSVLPKGRDEPNVTIDRENFYVTAAGLGGTIPSGFTAMKDESPFGQGCDSLALDGRQLLQCMYNWDECMSKSGTNECIGCNMPGASGHYGTTSSSNSPTLPLAVYKKCLLPTQGGSDWIANNTLASGGDMSWACDGGTLMRCKFALGQQGLNTTPLVPIPNAGLSCGNAAQGGTICMADPGTTFSLDPEGMRQTCLNDGRWMEITRITDIAPSANYYAYLPYVTLNLTLQGIPDDCKALLVPASSPTAPASYDEIAQAAESLALAGEYPYYWHNFTGLSDATKDYKIYAACRKGDFRTDVNVTLVRKKPVPLIQSISPWPPGKLLPPKADVSAVTNVPASCIASNITGGASTYNDVFQSPSKVAMLRSADKKTHWFNYTPAQLAQRQNHSIYIACAEDEDCPPQQSGGCYKADPLNTNFTFGWEMPMIDSISPWPRDRAFPPNVDVAITTKVPALCIAANMTPGNYAYDDIDASASRKLMEHSADKKTHWWNYTHLKVQQNYTIYAACINVDCPAGELCGYKSELNYTNFSIGWKIFTLSLGGAMFTKQPYWPFQEGSVSLTIRHTAKNEYAVNATDNEFTNEINGVVFNNAIQKGVMNIPLTIGLWPTEVYAVTLDVSNSSAFQLPYERYAINFTAPQ